MKSDVEVFEEHNKGFELKFANCQINDSHHIIAPVVVLNRCTNYCLQVEVVRVEKSNNVPGVWLFFIVIICTDI